MFAFDRVRRAILRILLVGGDKCGDWSGWYVENIPIADNRFDEHQASLDDNTVTPKKPKTTKGKKRQ